jgi:hypothetical protein
MQPTLQCGLEQAVWLGVQLSDVRASGRQRLLAGGTQSACWILAMC